MSVGTAATINVAADFIKDGVRLPNATLIEKMWAPISLGPFTVKAHPVDHSAFDALAFEIEADGHRVFYSGDLRFHGRTHKKSEHLIESPPRHIDAMIMEGSSLGRGPDEYPFQSEQQVARAFIKAIKGKRNLAMIYCAGQNVDRIASAYGAAKQTGRELVIDLYTAALLDAWKSPANRLIGYKSDGVRVLFWPNQMEVMMRTRRDLYDQIMRSKHGIKRDELLAQPQKFLVLAKANSLYDKHILRKLSSTDDLVMIWSMWSKYLERDNIRRHFQQFCGERGIAYQTIHASGHATVPDLTRLVSAMRPKRLIPIHTFYPEDYHRFGAPVEELKDGATLDLSEPPARRPCLRGS